MSTQVALVRVGIDKGSGGMYGPIFKDDTFEFIPIPAKNGDMTYGNTPGKYSNFMIEYFPQTRRDNNRNKLIHYDPEFETFTYGDPTSPKAGLRNLKKGDYLVFYCGLKGFECSKPEALYICAYFEVLVAGYAKNFSPADLTKYFSNNFHVKNRNVFKKQLDDLILVKGSKNSRLLTKAMRISAEGKDKAGRKLHVLSPSMQKVFGDLKGKISIQRSPTRWITPEHTEKAVQFIKSLA